MINVARIRYVTTHFNVLKGLAIVPWSICYLLGAVFTTLYAASSLSDATCFVLLIGDLLLAAFAQMLLLVYYRRTLGVVDNPMQMSPIPVGPTIRRKLRWLWISFVLVTAFVGLLAFWGTQIIDAQFSSMFIFRLLLALTLCLYCCTLGIHERLKMGYGHIPVWPIAAYLLLTLEPPAFLRSGATITLENLVIGLFFLGAGVYNHQLLVGSFQPMAKERG